MSTDPALSPKEIAEILNCSVRLVYSEIKKRRLGPCVRINHKVIWVRKSAVLAYLSQKTINSVS